jgi:hypothetical protein
VSHLHIALKWLFQLEIGYNSCLKFALSEQNLLFVISSIIAS